MIAKRSIRKWTSLSIKSHTSVYLDPNICWEVERHKESFLLIEGKILCIMTSLNPAAYKHATLPRIHILSRLSHLESCYNEDIVPEGLGWKPPSIHKPWCSYSGSTDCAHQDPDGILARLLDCLRIRFLRGTDPFPKIASLRNVYETNSSCIFIWYVFTPLQCTSTGI